VNFLQFIFMLLMFHGKFVFMLDILLGETLREEHKCFFLSQGDLCPKFVKVSLLAL
jgi:hypothetical protein